VSRFSADINLLLAHPGAPVESTTELSPFDEEPVSGALPYA
jgi:hypothetical protein